MRKSTGSLTSDYMSATLTAATVGVSATTLTAWESRYGFPAPRYIGQNKWYSTAAVEAWLASDERLKPQSKALRFGENHPKAWPKEFIAQALKLHAGGETLGRIAQRLGVPKATIQHWIDGSHRSRDPADAKVRARATARK